MTATITRHDPNAETLIDEGCYINELSNTPAEPELSIAQARVSPGVTTRRHRLEGVTERYVIVRGTGVVELGSDAPQRVTVGDVVSIPPGVDQRISNVGESDLVFLALCTPRFHFDAYQDTDDTPW